MMNQNIQTRVIIFWTLLISCVPVKPLKPHLGPVTMVVLKVIMVSLKHVEGKKKP